MKRFKIEQSETEIFTSNSGLALVGQVLHQFTSIPQALPNKKRSNAIADSDLVLSYLGLLCLGKNDFDAIEKFRQDEWFAQSLDVKHVPSAAILRQRFDEQADELITSIDTQNMELLRNAKIPLTPLDIGYIAVDIDGTPFDNSRTKKEGVSYTYKGHDGYTPLVAYLALEGWCLAIELREGSWHGQKEFAYFLERTLDRAFSVIGDKDKLLVRLDSGHDSLSNRTQLDERKADYLIKWNPRKKCAQEHLKKAESLPADQVLWLSPREGKRVAIYSIDVTESGKDSAGNAWTRSVRRVMRVVERTIDKTGQMLLEPLLEVEGWWTTLSRELADDESVIALYCDHGTSEQYHSEFKTDLDVERLPSGKFATNDLVLTLAGLAYNVLRLIGQRSLTGKHSPIRHPAKRRRIKTVIQELMYLAARVVRSGRSVSLRFSRHCRGFAVFAAYYQQLFDG